MFCTMMPNATPMSSPPYESRNVTDDRIAPQNSPRNRRNVLGAVKFETSLNGDVVVVEPSFDVDDDGEHCDESKGGSSSPHPSKADWQTRSPSGDEKSPRLEERSSPLKEDRTHGRNLSAHFLDATKLSEDPREATAREGEFFRDFKSRPEEQEIFVAGQKHPRGFSGDNPNPPVAHRRMNSVGRSKTVDKGYGGGYLEQQRRHHREDSAGLDILSAAADCTEEELAAVTDPRRRPARTPWDPPSSSHRNSPGAVGAEPYYSNGSMLGPPQPIPRQYPSPSHSHGYVTANSGLHPPFHPSHYHPSSFYPPPHPYHRGIPPNSGMGYPVQYAHRLDPYARHHHLPPNLQVQPPSSDDPGRQQSPSAHLGDDRLELDGRLHTRTPLPPVPPSQWRGGTSQGVQTFVTAIGVGDGNKMIQPTATQKNAGTNTDNMFAHPPTVPSMIDQGSHHRKMSSFSSLGTIIGSSMFAAEAANEHPLKKRPQHHRRASSSASFLHGFDVGLDPDSAFLHNLHASHGTDASLVPYCMPISSDRPPSPEEKDDSQKSDSKLAPGGTSKRVRRKCQIKDCPNRVVQGGLCIAHGAKRKTCKHPGCNKNVKKAGLCSTHGPARKRCDADGCSKVAVQGGKCIAHGAKKKLCSVDDCNKQAILAGMCKKHHDQNLGIASNRFGVPAKAEDSGSEETESRSTRQHSARHTRGLSIFQEIGADTVQDILSRDGPSGSDEGNRDGSNPQRPYINSVFL